MDKKDDRLVCDEVESKMKSETGEIVEGIPYRSTSVVAVPAARSVTSRHQLVLGIVEVFKKPMEYVLKTYSNQLCCCMCRWLNWVSVLAIIGLLGQAFVVD